MQTEIVLQTDNIEKIAKSLEKNLNGTGAKVSFDNGKAKCFFKDDENVRNLIAKSIREYIVENLEPKEIERLIEKGYGYFEKNEKIEFKNDIQEAIKAETDIYGKLFVLRRNRIIETAAAEYFTENSNLNLGGFVPFRLKDYLNEIENLIDYFADDFMMKREYDEFLSLLNTYVNMQESRVKLLNIVVTENREYLYYDGQNRLMNAEYEAEAALEFGENFSSEDLLINVLINKNPETVVIHNRQFIKKEIASTIERIFGDRIKLCNGCTLCKRLN